MRWPPAKEACIFSLANKVNLNFGFEIVWYIVRDSGNAAEWHTKKSCIDTQEGNEVFSFMQSVQIDYGIHPEITVNFVGSHYGEIYEALNS